MFYLTTHSTHFIYSYMASDIWLRTILIVRKETRCHHIGYSFRLTARVLLYAPSHRQDSTYHGLCYTNRNIFLNKLEINLSTAGLFQTKPYNCGPGLMQGDFGIKVLSRHFMVALHKYDLPLTKMTTVAVPYFNNVHIFSSFRWKPFCKFFMSGWKQHNLPLK